MQRSIGSALLLVWVALASGTGVFAQQFKGVEGIPVNPSRPGETGNYRIIKVADGVYSAIGLDGVFCNPAFIVNRDDVVIVDATARPSWARDLVSQIKKITDKPIRYVIYTDWHVDHSGGGQGFRDAFPNVQFIGHATLREDMEKVEFPRLAETLRATTPELLRKATLGIGAPAHITEMEQQLAAGKNADGQPLDEKERARLTQQIALHKAYFAELPSFVQSPLPDITYDREMVLHEGDRDIVLKYLGPSATRGDTFVYLPKEKIIFTGDVVGATPSRQDGYAEPYLTSLEELNQMDWVLAIGHLGPETAWLTPASKKPLLDGISFLKDMIPQVKDCVAKGMNLQQTLDAVNLSSHGPKAQTDPPVARYWAVLTHQQRSWENAPVLPIDQWIETPPSHQ